eukprot:9225917-Pyramimonas_sp.AAC.1
MPTHKGGSARSVQSQVSRDWQFGFAPWNLAHRPAANLGKTQFARASASSKDAGARVAPEE